MVKTHRNRIIFATKWSKFIEIDPFFAKNAEILSKTTHFGRDWNVEITEYHVFRIDFENDLENVFQNAVFCRYGQ